MSQSTLTSPLQALFPARLFGRTRPIARSTAVPKVRTPHADVVRLPSPRSPESLGTEMIRAQARLFLSMR
jgi:hypothetical protein